MWSQRSLSKTDFISTNQRKVNLRKVLFLAGKQINTKFFQNLFGNITRLYGKTAFSFKSSSKDPVYLRFTNTPPFYFLSLRFFLSHPLQRQEIFLLLMEENLVGVLQGMSLDDDVPIVLPDDDDFSAIERSSRSLMDRLLNPACQNMARMLRTMPKIWRVYDRVRMALTSETFQFIFELETDLQMVLKCGFWTFEDWGLVLERWVESPPSTFLQTAAVWLRISNIPVNYFTIKTIDSVAGAIGYVKDIEWDPSKPLLQNYVRVKMIMDLNLPVRDKKSLTLPKGGGDGDD